MKNLRLLSVEGIDATKEITDVTLGRKKADLAVINANLLNVYTGELLENHSVSVKGDWIAYVGEEPGDNIGPDTLIIDALGKTLIPGLIDGHTHLADSLYNPYEFLRYAMAGGTTTIITETIEPFPVMGYEGLLEFMASLKDQPVKIFATVPAMVTTSRAVKGISRVDLERLLARDDILGLGESYWQGVLQKPGDFLPNFLETLRSGKGLEGHLAGARGRNLMAYIAPGISSDHEPISAGEVLERLRLGLFVMAREGSIRRDLASISDIMGSGIDLRRLILVSDGVSALDLWEKGYMEYVVQKAIDCGFDPVDAIRMATLNPAEYFRLDGIIGGLAPGRYADMLIIPDLKTIKAEYVISRGRIIARDGTLMVRPRSHGFSRDSLNSVSLPRELQASDFTIAADEKDHKIKVRVIDQITDLVTREFIASVPVIDGKILSDVTGDLLKVAAVDRTNSPGKTFVGLIRGFRLRAGAIASSSAWDTSDIIVIGADDEDMAFAVNRVRSLQGGAVVAVKGKILAEIPLPVFGLMTDLSMEALVTRYREMTGIIHDLGAVFADPLRTLITLTGAAIPFIRICEQGLIDIKSGNTLELILR